MNRRQFLVRTGLAAAGLLSYQLLPNGLRAQPTEPEGLVISATGQAPLPYAYDALTPYIDARTMEIHYSKHHAGYVAQLVKALESDPPRLLAPLADTLAKLKELPASIQEAVRNHGGGHYNHSLFWHILRPSAAAKAPSEAFLKRLTDTFGSFDDFKTQFEKVALGQFGSGWAWLIETTDRKLALTATANQDNPLMPDVPLNGRPLLGVDVWEHAYYLSYQNRRAEYLKAIWPLIHWPHVEAMARS
jgi:Fe-Mn family superoxide dismutase